MTTTFRTLLIAGLLVSAAAPAGAQSANRTPPNVPPPPAKVGTLAPESDAVRRCRVHCQMEGASANVTSPHPSVAERQARQAYCAKRMP